MIVDKNIKIEYLRTWLLFENKQIR